MQNGQQSTAMVRKEFGGEELAPIVETAASAVQARATAAVQARAIVALNRPRDLDTVRVRLLKECERPGFAAVARYRLPRGGKSIEGPSIRFAEAVVRNMGNLDITVDVIFDAPEKRIVKVAVVDLETNAAYSADVTIDKVVERRELREGQQAIGTRLNSAGKTVYLVPADEGELLVKQAALVSKSLRTSALRLLPGDILEECMARVMETLRKGDAADPEAARKKLVDGFAAIGVMPDALKSYLGCDLAAASPAQVDELRAIYVGIKDGEATWAEIVGEKAKADAGEAAPGPSKVQALREKVAARKASKPQPREPGGEG